MEERRESLAEIMPEFTKATDMDELARLADATRINLFGANVEEPWPTEAPDRFSFHTVRELKKGRAAVLLVKVEHSCEVPAGARQDSSFKQRGPRSHYG